MKTLPEASIDLIFADPPYNLQLRQELWRPNLTRVEAVNDEWDQFKNLQEYDAFTQQWLSACRRVLKDTGAIWVIGTYHNIYRVGAIMQDLGYWFLNDITWIKTNPMPNFRGVRFTNAHETLIWASKSKGARYVFNYHAMKGLNDELQMRSDWLLPICSGQERIKVNGKKAHSTQKPEALLYRLVLASSEPGQVVMDPFFGSGTTGAVAKKLHRRFIGIEKDPSYIRIARERIDRILPPELDPRVFEVRGKRRLEARLLFPSLLENGLLLPGQKLYFLGDKSLEAEVKPDGRLIMGEFEGSIHQASRRLTNGIDNNIWDKWHFEDKDGGLHPIEELRRALRAIQTAKNE
jgi:site-specific DNA-methyltransferase (adenine-specific)